jgi:glycosyltransferase involved in cell wall biosynthesis
MGGSPSVRELACGVLSLRAERGLVAAVRSLLEQSEPLEIVVVNSGGGQARRRLSRAGIDVRVIEVPERLLPGAARNLAIDATCAPYVSFLAADCVALPGWAAGRLREHRQGAVAVAGAMANAHPHSLSARAAYLLLHNRRMPETPAHMRLHYSLSYERAVFERHGRFREDLRAGEDSEFNARVEADAEIAWAPDVRAAHRNPRNPVALVRDQYRRGGRRVAMERIDGLGHRSNVIRGAQLNIGWSLDQARRVADPRERRRLLRARPLIVAGSLAYRAGAHVELARGRGSARDSLNETALAVDRAKL